MEKNRRLINARVLYFVVVIFVIILIAAFWFCWFHPMTTILLVRHAEKQGGGPNPNLSVEGQNRAQTLVNVVGDAAVTVIYATEFCRTSQTAQPLAAHLGLPINIQQNTTAEDELENCNPSINVQVNRIAAQIDTIEEFVDNLLDQNRGGVAFLVGHSNTVPQIIEQFGAASIPPISENEYDNLFVVTVPKWFGNPRIIRAKYGD